MASLLSSSCPSSSSSSLLRNGSSALAMRVILPHSPEFLGLRRGKPTAILAAAAAGGKRYWGTAIREEKLAEMIEKKVAEAMEACEGEALGSEGCRVAWDEVEEVSMAKADLRRRIADSGADPLEHFCQGNPDADECRIYED
ncbi:Calvin cycle protein CP12-3, chloroplastic [Apostasia shenzhenica]|uniref:Calvin cycle protein CP12-3, chloroplastic n=1 Tax=Apostasia shenzhenica TaxID=1088818 RepID=A0A2H9ZVK7_9ASPA|nr:Calvin cycle protein CP12-3, chloroplastic [Apostasia shenzhenica]